MIGSFKKGRDKQAQFGSTRDDELPVTGRIRRSGKGKEKEEGNRIGGTYSTDFQGSDDAGEAWGWDIFGNRRAGSKASEQDAEEVKRQKFFGYSMLDAVHQAATGVLTDEKYEMSVLLPYLANRRNEIAKAMSEARPMEFGAPRWKEFAGHTPLDGPYEEPAKVEFNLLMDLMQRESPGFGDPDRRRVYAPPAEATQQGVKELAHLNLRHRRGSGTDRRRDPGYYETYRIAKANGKQVFLTNTIIQANYDKFVLEGAPISGRLVEANPRKGNWSPTPPGWWEHPAQEYDSSKEGDVVGLDENVLVELEVLADEIRMSNPRYPESEALILDHLARIQWWIANLMPWDRGSAAIADMVVKSILAQKGMQAYRRREGVAGDIESFYMSYDKYAREWPSFFDHPPQYRFEEVEKMRAVLSQASEMARSQASEMASSRAPEQKEPVKRNRKSGPREKKSS